MLDTLFAKLQSTTDPLAAQALEQAIWEQWTMLPDPDQRQLMLRGMAEMQQQDLQSAVATFTKLIGIAPDLSEPWNKRATVYWLLGNFGCIGNIASGTGIPVVHTVELLDWATGGPTPAAMT